MQINTVNIGGITNSVWSAATRTLTADPATDAGAAAFVWTHAARTITQNNGFAFGMKVQSPVLLTAQSITSVATTGVLNYSATGGMLIAAGVTCTTGFTSGLVTCLVDVIIDGNTTSFPIYTNSIMTWDPGLQALANLITGNGSVAGNALNLQLPLGFVTSLVVQLRVTASTLGAGALTVSVLYAHP
jgi:hypothetical protein